METESKPETGQLPTTKASSAATCSPLGKIHKWWLREFRQHTKLMVDYGYAGTPYGKALIGLMNRGLIKFVMGFEGAGLIGGTSGTGLINNGLINANDSVNSTSSLGVLVDHILGATNNGIMQADGGSMVLFGGPFTNNNLIQAILEKRYFR